MRHRLRELLACPACGGSPLALEVYRMEPAEGRGPGCRYFCSQLEQRIPTPSQVPTGSCPGCYETEIIEGSLSCPQCCASYPIIGGIPRFNPDVASDFPEFFRRYGNEAGKRSGLAAFEALQGETKGSFGFQWLRYRVTDDSENDDHFERRTGERPGHLGRRLFFEAGCGMGRYLQVVGRDPSAEVVGLDLSLAVNRAYEENRNNPRIQVVQGDIMNLPLRAEMFDHVYSIGVLHHTPDTRQAFHSIAKLVAPGGRISVWLYHAWRFPGLEGFEAVHATLKGWITDGLRVVTTRLPHRLLHYLCYLAVPFGWLQIQINRMPRPLKVLLSPFLLVGCSIHPQRWVRVLDTFDWYSPRYQWKHTIPEVVGWFEAEGLEGICPEGEPVTVRGHRPAALAEKTGTLD